MRGAVMIAALHRYAPGLTLTPETLHEPNVVRRFVAREEARARLRIPQDLSYFRTTTCLVQLEPEAAIAVVYSDARSRDLRVRIAQMIDRGRQCVGGATRVAFDPLQFRVCLADSLYRWAAAAKNVDSLVPQELEG